MAKKKVDQHEKETPSVLLRKGDSFGLREQAWKQRREGKRIQGMDAWGKKEKPCSGFGS